MIRRTVAVVALIAVWLAAALGGAAIAAYASGYTEPLDWLMGPQGGPDRKHDRGRPASAAGPHQAPPATTDRGSTSGAADIDALDREAELAAADRADAQAPAVAELEAALAAVRANAEAMATADQADAQLAAEAALEALNSALEADAVRLREALADVGMLHPVAIREEDLEGLSHPEVQKQARAIVENVVASHEQEWPWLRSAYEAAPWLFYDLQGDLPCGSDSAAACVTYQTSLEEGPKRDLLVSTHLDAVRSARFVDLVVHELAHVWEHTTTEGTDMAAAFSVHYVGCYVPGRLDTEALPSELLADAVTMTVLQAGYLAQPTAQELLDREMQAWLYGSDYDYQVYGYYGLDFEGCLVDNEPTEELWSLLHIYLSGLEPIEDGTASIDETTEQQTDESVDQQDQSGVAR